MKLILMTVLSLAFDSISSCHLGGHGNFDKGKELQKMQENSNPPQRGSDTDVQQSFIEIGQQNSGNNHGGSKLETPVHRGNSNQNYNGQGMSRFRPENKHGRGDRGSDHQGSPTQNNKVPNQLDEYSLQSNFIALGPEQGLGNNQYQSEYRQNEYESENGRGQSSFSSQNRGGFGSPSGSGQSGGPRGGQNHDGFGSENGSRQDFGGSASRRNQDGFESENGIGQRGFGPHNRAGLRSHGGHGERGGSQSGQNQGEYGSQNGFRQGSENN